MNVLFISYAEVSLRGDRVRTVAMLRALADAGHRVDVVASSADIPDHPHIRILEGCGSKPLCRSRLRMRCLQAFGRISYDAVHAVDDAVFFGERLCRWKKIPFVYDASRRFTGTAGTGAGTLLRLFPKILRRSEERVLLRAKTIFSPCPLLTADLLSLDREASVVQLEGVPMQSLHVRQDVDRAALFLSYDVRPGPVVVCSVLPGCTTGLRNLFVALRKVVDASPDTVFFFRGGGGEQAGKMAANLDIAERCIFLPSEDAAAFLSVLDVADAALLIPQRKSRYVHPIVYTLLNAGAPLVTVHEAAYDEVLTEKTSVQVLESADSIAEGILRVIQAEGILRVIQEPLFSLAVAMEGQQLVADRYTYSSFKHKVRMTYHQVFKQE
jgi:hypothetical protein